MQDGNISDDDILNDLDDLENDENIDMEYNKNDDYEVEDEEEKININKIVGNNQEQHDEAIEEFQGLFQHKSKEVSYLVNDREFLSFIEKIKVLVLSRIQKQINVDHEEYKLIKRGNEYGAIIDRELQSVHKYLKDLYQKKFSELEKIVLNPIEYAKCVKLIGNQTQYDKIDFSKLLTSHQILTITVAGSTSTGQQLSKQEQEKAIEASDVILKLEEYSRLVQLYVETRMQYIAPNLSALVGTQCSSRLMAAAGGIEALSAMPACNIQVMGSQKKALLGFSKANQGFNRGYFGQLEFVQKAPPIFQTKLVRMLSTNVAKCARIDFLRTCPNGSAGERIKELMIQRFDKIQEPPQGKLDKPLPIPDDKPKAKRGGKRFRRMKERAQQTEIQKYKNRLTFGEEAEQEYGTTGEGFGQLSNSVGQSSGKIKININKNQKLKLSKKQQERLVTLNGQKSGAQSGISSSICFTPVQGMELINPQKKMENQIDNYFNKEAGFRTVTNQNKKKSLLEKLGPVGLQK